MLQVFQMDVAKVDRDVAMIVFVASSCYQCFIFFFDVCCRYVYLDVVYIFAHIFGLFAGWFVGWFRLAGAGLL